MSREDTLRKQLELAWQDHIQTRAQTWKTLEIEALLLVGMVGADLKFNTRWVLVCLAVVLMVSGYSGAAITLHHRRGQVQKFTHIERLEKALGLHTANLLSDVHPPKEFRWLDIVNPKAINTPLFILRMHLAIVAFAVVYLIARWRAI